MPTFHTLVSVLIVFAGQLIFAPKGDSLILFVQDNPPPAHLVRLSPLARLVGRQLEKPFRHPDAAVAFRELARTPPRLTVRKYASTARRITVTANEEENCPNQLQRNSKQGNIPVVMLELEV